MKTNKQKLTKDKVEYLHVLYTIWTAISYYSELFKIDAGEEPAEMETFLLDRGGMTIVRFKLPAFEVDFDELTEDNYTSEQMVEIIQQYLDYCILPSDKILRPYLGGSTIYDIVEPLYIDRMEETKGIWRIDVVYIDSPTAFQYVQECKKSKGVKIIW